MPHSPFEKFGLGACSQPIFSDTLISPIERRNKWEDHQSHELKLYLLTQSHTFVSQ